MKQGLVAILMPLSVLASTLSQENACQKCILNQVRTDSAAHLNLVQTLPRETAGSGIARGAYRGLGLSQMNAELSAVTSQSSATLMCISQSSLPLISAV